MSASKQELRRIVGELSEEESRIILTFAEWIRDHDEEFTSKEIAIIERGEKQIRDGDFVRWRDVKRTKV